MKLFFAFCGIFSVSFDKINYWFFVFNHINWIANIILLLQVCLLAQGQSQSQYVVEIEFFGYNNPTGRCHECPVPANSTTASCCDSFAHSSCNGSDLCDSYFYFCLRTIGDSRTTNGCLYPGSNVTFAIIDDAPFNINNISAVLGIDNPLVLPGLTMDFEVKNSILCLFYNICNLEVF